MQCLKGNAGHLALERTDVLPHWHFAGGGAKRKGWKRQQVGASLGAGDTSARKKLTSVWGSSVIRRENLLGERHEQIRVCRCVACTSAIAWKVFAHAHTICWCPLFLHFWKAGGVMVWCLISQRCFWEEAYGMIQTLLTQNFKIAYTVYHKCRCAATYLQTSVNTVLCLVDYKRKSWTRGDVQETLDSNYHLSGHATHSTAGCSDIIWALLNFLFLKKH